MLPEVWTWEWVNWFQACRLSQSSLQLLLVLTALSPVPSPV